MIQNGLVCREDIQGIGFLDFELSSDGYYSLVKVDGEMIRSPSVCESC